MLCFAIQCRDTKQVRWEMFTSCYGNFNRENMCKILSESASFSKRHDKNIQMSFLVHSLLFTCKMQGQCRDIIWVMWKTFMFLYDKFAQDNMDQILSESVGFCRRDDKNILMCFFGWRFSNNVSNSHTCNDSSDCLFRYQFA